MRVAVLQLAYGDEEPVAERVERVCELVRRQAGHDLVVLPELWAPGGFAYRDWEERAETLDGPVAQALGHAARHAGVTLHGGSIVERGRPVAPGGPGRWNTSLVYSPAGELVATYRKIHRFGFRSGEPRLMEAGSEPVVVDVPVADGAPARVGLSTCYDLRFPELYRALVDRGAEVFVVPAAWPAARVAHWRVLGLARAIEDQCVVVQCNTAGTHAGHEMGGRSQVVGPDGRVLAAAGTEEEVLSVEVDVPAVRRLRADFPVLADRRLPATSGLLATGTR